MRRAEPLESARHVHLSGATAADGAPDAATVEALRQSEERFRAIVGNARDYAIFSLDPDGAIVDWLPGAQSIFGWTRDEAVGTRFEVLFTAEDRAAGVPAEELARAAASGSAPDVRWHLRKDRSRVFIEGKTVALRSAAGALQGFLKIGQDVTERRHAEEALRASEQRFRQFSDASADILWIRDAQTLQFEHVSPAFESVYGEAFERVFSGDNFTRWAELILAEDRQRAVENVRRVQQGARLTHEFRVLRPSDGELRWIRDTLFPLRDEHGRVSAVGGIGEDVTVAKAHTDRLHVLNAELQHRTRNLIAVVRAVVQNTLEGSASLEDFNARFVPRLDALSRVQSLLSRGANGYVDFEDVLMAELAAHGATELLRGQVRLEGPRGVALMPNSVQTVVLAVHELATNAVKYGALSQPGAQLSVTWQVTPRVDDQLPRLHIDWRESGVTMPATAPRSGYGRELIEHALPYQLGATTRYELRDDGVSCMIEIPVDTS